MDIDDFTTELDVPDFNLTKEMARAFAISTATTAGMIAGVIVTALVVEKVRNRKRGAKLRVVKTPAE